MARSSRNGGLPRRDRQHGVAILMTLALIGLLIAIFIVVLVNDIVRENLRRQHTNAALAKAKEALIGYAVSIDLTNGGVNCSKVTSPTNHCARPGDLPCPDLDDDGSADSGCGAATGIANQPSRIGRLPWKTLGLPDLRDGDGERLWYAVSNNYKNRIHTQCLNPGDAGCLNSSTPGTITLRDRSGTIENDGSNAAAFSGAVALVISPGAILTRDGAGSGQDRSCAGGSCLPADDASGICTSTPATATAKCNPVNYLDTVNGGEDNADFVDGGTDGFINGPVLTGNRVIVNDSILPIKYSDLMPMVEKRVAQEAMNCLTAYANAANGRYPWAASVTEVDDTYADVNGLRFGRLPDTFGSTILGALALPTGPIINLQAAVNEICQGLTSLVALAPGSLCMSNKWPTAGTPSCSIAQDNQGWWLNWKDQVFYGVAGGYSPSVLINIVSLLPPEIGIGIPAAGCAGNCLTVNPPVAAADKRVVVIVAGRALAGQSRATNAEKSDIANYLEGANATYDGAAPENTTFAKQSSSNTFNDYVLYQ